MPFSRHLGEEKTQWRKVNAVPSAVAALCAGYLGHPFEKSDTCTHRLFLAMPLAVTKRDTCQEK